MRWKSSFIHTLKEDPQEAEIASHRLMLRAGVVQRLVTGGYSYLPLGFRALTKAMQIIRQEMNAAGAVEVLMPLVHPQELWEETGRVEEYGPVMLKFSDRKGSPMILAPTHEESVTDMVRRSVTSYKQLPFTVYQIQTKYRDEARPRYGVIRTREFLMKDAYSFDATQEGLDATYERMYAAYLRIFERCGIPVVPVDADSGSIGGSASCEFMVPCEVGEDKLVHCDSCGYGGNVEKAPVRIPEVFAGACLSVQELETPGQKTIEDLRVFCQENKSSNPAIGEWVSAGLLAMGLEGEDSSPLALKTLLYKVGDKVVMLLVNGAYEVNEVKLANVFEGKGFEVATEEDARALLGAGFGSLGPVGAKDVEIYADHGVRAMGNMICGANKDGVHLLSVNHGRDFEVTHWVDVRSAKEGGRCAVTDGCEGEYTMSLGMELGHVFKLGTRYTKAMKATFLDRNGSRKDLIMGCYGIGVNRIIASAVEVFQDEQGINWPLALAPYEVLITVMDVKKAELMEAAMRVYEDCKAKGLDVLIDDRDARAGVKFKDADLIGIPIRITMGMRGLKDGNCEIKLRKNLSKEDNELIPISAVLGRALELKRTLS